jgi:histidine triad (HIT) family protein
LASPSEGCLFCRLAREGEHLRATEGFVAIADINPQAPVHLLVIPERHLDSFREIDALGAEESRRMLAFIAETARANGLEDYRVVANVGAGAGQTVFHLHWHILGDPGAGAAPGVGAAAR